MIAKMDVNDLSTFSVAADRPGSNLAAMDLKDFEEAMAHVCHDLTEFGWANLSVLDYVPPELIPALMAEVRQLHSEGSMKEAGIGRGANHSRDRSIRRDRIVWLKGDTEPQAALFQFLELVRMDLNRLLFLGLSRFEAHYASYESGDFYRRHIDSFKGRRSRIVSMVLYLNDQWQSQDGGMLRLFNRDSPDEICGTVLPEAGRMVLFMSEEMPHEVLTAQRTRYSLACWFRQDEVPIPL
ncbi:MAG: 2OG-Fe(II) oxygenase [Marinobacter sp.]|uniref:2OG-Fe(II) oxygenase n=1 Tax=Marinobacter sp. TaxID=50741 RepID=UPI0034A01251